MNKLTEERLIARYGMFIYYEAVERYEQDNLGKYFDDLNDDKKIRCLDSQMLYALRG